MLEIKEWYDDYDLLKTFYSKEVIIYSKDKKDKVIITLPSVKTFLDHDDYALILNFFKQPIGEITKNFSFWEPKSYYQFFKLITFELNNIVEFQSFHTALFEFLNFILQKNEIVVDQQNQQIFINNIILNEELWDYIWYIIWTGFGDKRNKPRIFKNEAEKNFFEQQEKMEEKIRQIRSRGTQISEKKKDNINQLLKMFSVIMYSFKQLNFDFLFNCTNAQIYWLYEYAQKIANYEVEASIFAAGNSKKKKLEFFTEK